MPLEKEHQAETYRTLKQFGWATKLVQDATVCMNCHHKVHPIHVGWADYHAELASDHGPVAIKVECKGGRERFNTDQWNPEQILWMSEWQKVTGGQGYLWLQLGDKKVGSSNAMARRAWLVPFEVMVRVIQETNDRGYKYIPINEETALAYNMRNRYPEWSAEIQFWNYRLEWIGDKMWKPTRIHPIWSLTNVKYDEFTTDRSRIVDLADSGAVSSGELDS